MQISVKSNIDEIARDLPRELRRQIPFAASQALNDTARHIATLSIRSDIEKDLDRPTPFTKSGFRYKNSRKTNLTSEVYILPTRWDYLNYQINGGTREAKGKAIPIQITDAGLAFFKRNKYGNLPRNAIKKATQRRDTFWGEARGIYGLWRRVGDSSRQLNLLAFTVPRTTYKERFDYAGHVDREAGVLFTKEFAKRLTAAIRTAK